jgi:hypothetical protein
MIDFEDRTTEAKDEAYARRVTKTGELLMLAAMQFSEATPAIGLGGLALALGRGAARTGADLEQVLEAVRQHYEEAAGPDGDDATAETPLRGEN